ncbi:MAG: hypothetical protein GX416_07585 [Bacteroidales bacterium]|nr:hypothetical protein [Bacteroidales bacterium]
MKSYLIWISYLLFIAMSGSAQVADGSHKILLFNSEGSARYSFSIQTKKAELTGIYILRSTNEQVSGSVFNEFGIKAFDMIFLREKAKVKLMNVIGFLNKWYIRNVVKKDMRFLFITDFQNKIYKDPYRSIEYNADGTIVLKNLKYGLIYTFIPLKEQQDDKHEIAE